MCRLYQAACRVCLTENISPPYIYLLEDENVSEAIGNALHLQTCLYDASLYPNHICETCNKIIEPFIKLKDIALGHEKFLLKYQEKIKQFGIEETKSSQLEEIYSCSNNPCEADEAPNNFEQFDSTLDFDLESDKYLDKNVKTSTENIKYEPKLSNAQIVSDEETHCPLCGPSRILKKSSLPNHLKTFHKEKDIDCEVSGCDKKFKKQSDMKRHVRTIHKGERSQCSQCGEHVKDLHYHIRVFHENVNFPCEVCNKKYTTKQGLNFHMKHSHGESKKEVCDYCAVEVKHVKHHIKMMHSGVVEKKISCQDESCEKMFRTKQEASIHYNAAHLNKKEMCPLCGGWYKNLYTHIHQTHHSQKKHVCDQCGKAFGKKNDLKVHKDRIHLLKRYICPECGKTISKIREHLKTVHSVASVNMAEIEVAKFDSSSVPRVEEGSSGQQIKNYNSNNVPGSLSIPLDTKTGAMVPQHQAWNL